MKKYLCALSCIVLLLCSCASSGVVVSFPSDDSSANESAISMEEIIPECDSKDIQMLYRMVAEMEGKKTFADFLDVIEEAGRETFVGEDITWLQAGNVYRPPMTYFEITVSRQYHVENADSPMLMTCTARYPVMSLDKEWDLCFQSSDYGTIEEFYQAVRESAIYKKMADVEMEDFDIHGMLIPES